MKRLMLAGALLAVVGAISFSNSQAQDAAANKADAPSELVGTWKLVSAKYDGQKSEPPAGTSMVKHVTPEQFMWVIYDDQGKVLDAAGGTYSIKDEEYVESPVYGLGEIFDAIKGKKHTFKWKVDGNHWQHNGKLDDGLMIEEVWERVEKK